MNVLFVGDIVGPAAVAWLADRLPDLRRRHAVDLAIANAENAVVSRPTDAWQGFGQDRTTVDRLFGAGVDVITGGNHSWDNPDADEALAHPRVLRPHNLPPGRPGRGLLTLEVGGEPVTVLNLADPDAIPDALPPLAALRSAEATGAIIVDYHGDSSQPKRAFAHAVDGEVAAVLGTHTHEPSLVLHRLPEGTAFVLDVGMTGPQGGWGGIDPARMLAYLRGDPREAWPPVALAGGPQVLGAVLLRIEGGRTEGIERLA